MKNLFVWWRDRKARKLAAENEARRERWRREEEESKNPWLWTPTVWDEASRVYVRNPQPEPSADKGLFPPRGLV